MFVRANKALSPGLHTTTSMECVQLLNIVCWTVTACPIHWSHIRLFQIHLDPIQHQRNQERKLLMKAAWLMGRNLSSVLGILENCCEAKQDDSR